MRRTMRRFIAQLGLVLILAAGLVAYTGCDLFESDADERGQIDIYLTDAPGDIIEAFVTIERVAVVPASEAAEGEAREGGISVLDVDAFTVDLTKLQDGVDTLMASTTLPEGTYSQIRLVTAREADVLYEDEEGNAQEANLRLPSAAETGVKVNFPPFTVESERDRIELTLDFDIEESFVKAGESGSFIFKPVVKAEAMVVNGEEEDLDGDENDEDNDDDTDSDNGEDS